CPLRPNPAKAVKPVSDSVQKWRRGYASRRNALNFWLPDLGSNNHRFGCVPPCATLPSMGRNDCQRHNQRHGETGNPKEDEINKQVSANLESWYKRNGSRIKLMDDLTLDCEVCKTKEAKELIKKEIDTTLKNF